VNTTIEPRRAFPWIGTVVGGLVGAFVFYVGGAFLLLALAADESDGWAGLAAVAAAMITFAPLGAIVGGMFGARRRFVPWWRARPGLERTLTVVLALLGAAAPAFFTEAAWEAVALATWGLAGGAIVGHMIGRIAT
jgi:hypothetical protein